MSRFLWSLPLNVNASTVTKYIYICKFCFSSISAALRPFYSLNTFPVLCYSKGLIATCEHLYLSLPFNYFAFQLCCQSLLGSLMEQLPLHKSTSILSWNSGKEKVSGALTPLQPDSLMSWCALVNQGRNICALQIAFYNHLSWLAKHFFFGFISLPPVVQLW